MVALVGCHGWDSSKPLAASGAQPPEDVKTPPDPYFPPPDAPPSAGAGAGSWAFDVHRGDCAGVGHLVGEPAQRSALIWR